MDGETQSEPKRLAQWGRVILRVLGYIIRLLWEAFCYLGRTCLDLFFAIRFLLLWREHRRSPTRSWEFNSQISSLVERRAKRWAEWYTLSVWRRLEIRIATLVVLVAIFFGVRFFVTHPENASTNISPQSQTVYSESEKTVKKSTEEGRVIPPKSISKTALTENQTNGAKFRELAEDFANQRESVTPNQWLLYRGNPVLIRGELNQWDDFKVGSPVVIKEGNNYRMWYRGCHLIGDEYTCGIGHAISQDGVIWEKSPEPLFVIENPDESRRLNTVAVVRAGDHYMMWYSINADPFHDRPYATIRLATSTDGLKWHEEGAVLRAINEGTTSIEHTAFYDGRIFHLWYVDSSSTATGAEKSLMHVASSDGKKWQISGSMPIETLGVNPGRVWILSDGRGGYRGFFTYPPREQREKGLFGVLTSADGNTWRILDEKTNAMGALGRDIIADAPAVLSEPGGLWMWFVQRPEDGAEAIDVAYRKEGAP